MAQKFLSAWPEGFSKNYLRRIAFKIIFFPWGARSVKIGPTNNKIEARIVKFLGHQESLGEREMDGYLQRYTPKEGEVVVNAGAYHGYFAIYLSRLVGEKGRVICFEPEPNNVSVLRRNIQLNRCENVTIITKGLWDKVCQLPIVPKGSGSAVEPQSCGTTSIALSTLDEQLHNMNISAVNFMAMDIEGAEIKAVDGAKKIISDSPNINLAIAAYHKMNNQPTWRTLEPLLKQYGLMVQTSFPRHLTTYAWRQ